MEPELREVDGPARWVVVRQPEQPVGEYGVSADRLGWCEPPDVVPAGETVGAPRATPAPPRPEPNLLPTPAPRPRG